MASSTRKRSRSTVRQLAELVDMMLASKDLALGKCSGARSYEKNERMWDAVAEKISAFGPPKTGAQCKTTWRDLKVKIRNKNAKIKECRTATSNNGAVPGLSEMDLKVLSIIGTESSEGGLEEESSLEGQHSVVVPELNSQSCPNVESVFIFDDVKIKNEDSCDTSPMSRCEDVVVEDFTPPSNRITPQVRADAKATGTKRKRSFVDVDEVPKNYADLQEKCNAILTSIAVTLKERNIILRERNDIERERNALKRIELSQRQSHEDI